MGSYRCSIGHVKLVDADQASFGIVGNTVNLSFTTDPGESTADFRIPAQTGSLTTRTFTNNFPRVGGGTGTPAAGDIVELAAGNHGPLVLTLVGSSANRIIFRGPPTGQAIIRHQTRGTNYVTSWRGCRHVTVDAETSDTSIPLDIDGKRRNIKMMYGIEAVQGGTSTQKSAVNSYIKTLGTSNSGAAPFNVSRDMTWRYIHVEGGWNVNPALSWSTNPGIAFSIHDHDYKRFNFPGSYIENHIVEHVLCTNLPGEGTYIGSNPYMSYRGGGSETGGPDCPPRYIKVRHGWFQNIGGNGISIKSVFGGTHGGDETVENSIHDNVVILCGIDPTANGLAAIISNSGKTDFYNNWIERCGSHGIQINVSNGTNVPGFPGATAAQRAADDAAYGITSLTFTQRVYNNVIRNNGGTGITAISYQVDPPDAGASVIPAAMKPRALIFCNTSVGNATGISLNTAGAHASSMIRNNIAVDNATNISFGPISSNTTNITSGTAADYFVDPTGNGPGIAVNMNLSGAQLISGAALGLGLPGVWPLSVDTPNFDYDGDGRSLNPDKGAYEL